MSGDLVIQLAMVLLMVGALLTVPLGLPGVWIMIVILAGGLLMGWVAWPTWLLLAALTGVAELLEFVVLKKMGDRYGGTRASFWGAIIGGFVGVLVGAPIPIVGSLLAGMVGTFVGAALATFHGGRSLTEASRVGKGMLFARVLSVALKVAVGIAVLVIGGGALLVR